MRTISTKADEILATARALMLHRGYNGFSYADIADVVGIRKASIHHHFHTKTDLVSAVVEAYRAEARDGLLLLATMGSPIEQLQVFTRRWADCITDDSAPFCLCALLASELPALPPVVATEVRGHFIDMVAWLERLLADGERQGIFVLRHGAATDAEIFLATLHGAMLSARAYGNTTTFAAIEQPMLGSITKPH